MCVAAVNHDIAGCQQTAELSNNIVGDLTCRQHYPDGSRRIEFAYQLIERGRAFRAFSGQRQHRGRRPIVDRALVAAGHQAPHHIGAHAPETHHSDLHVDERSSSFSGQTQSGLRGRRRL